MSGGGQQIYARSFGGQAPGQLGDSAFGRRTEGWLNAAGADQPAGIGVIDGQILGVSGEFVLPSLATDPLAGITVLSFARDPGSAAIILSGGATIKAGAVADLLCEGAIAVLAEQILHRGDPVYVRFAANGGNTQIGAFRKDDDAGHARLVRGARVLVDSEVGQNGNTPVIYFSRAADGDRADVFDVPFSHGSIAANVTAKITATRAGQFLVIDGADYVNPAGLAHDPVNFWAIDVINPSATLAAIDTHAADLPANAYVPMALNVVPANLISAPDGTPLSVAITKTGNPPALPAGSGVLHAHYA